MYGTVPTSMPLAVAGSCVATAVGESGVRVDAGDLSFARPKSSSFAPDLVNITLLGFRSR
jgi:hypothetical protein